MARYLKSTEFIQFAVRDRIARITLNRPDKRNALNQLLIDEMHDALLEADSLADVNVVVLSGAGRDFSAGYDLKQVYYPEDGDDEKYRTIGYTFDDGCWNMEMKLQRQISTLSAMHKPVIAKVHGNCLAGGTDLALMCDMVIAAEDAKIGFPAARANGTPPNHMWFYHVGPQWAKRLLMTGDCVSGRDAARIGLVLDAVPAAELDATVDELARRISFIDAEMLTAHKRIVNIALELSGAGTLQRMAIELDARAHLAQGPRRTQFWEDVKANGLQQAFKNRDEPFGDGVVKIHSASK